jgi:hypothetical protein
LSNAWSRFEDIAVPMVAISTQPMQATSTTLNLGGRGEGI